MKSVQRGGLILGLVIGLLVGLGLALAVALYVTKAPVPFVNKVPPRTADQDVAEAERNKTWDPNAGLSGKGTAAKAAEPAASVVAAVAPPATAIKPPAVIAAPGARDPAAILSGAPVAPGMPAASAARPTPAGAASPTATPAAAAASGSKSARIGSDPFVYFVQAGAFQSSDEAEQQRARLAILGVETRLIEREQSGRMVFRVRSGPYTKQPEAEAVKEKLLAAGVEAMLVRVERQP